MCIHEIGQQPWEVMGFSLPYFTDGETRVLGHDLLEVPRPKGGLRGPDAQWDPEEHGMVWPYREPCDTDPFPAAPPQVI